ncbi:MAG: DoxX family protein [Pirellulales bacterium]
MPVDFGLLLLLVLFGTAIAAHSSRKLFDVLGGYGLKGTGAFFESLGFRPGRLSAFMAGSSELVGGLLLVSGLSTPVGAALVLATMIVALATVHLKNGFFAANNGIELPSLFAATALALIFTGGGAYSTDAVFKTTFLSLPYVTECVLGCAQFGATLNMTFRRHAHLTAART